jgi:bifunctional non-homologous end joining protein LigD
MMAVAGELPTGPEWVYEYKWDGIRATVRTTSDCTRVYSRTGRDLTRAFPELAGLVDQLPDSVIDGELISLDASGAASFGRIIERMHTTDPAQVSRLVKSVPATYMIFDLLRLDGTDVRELPYATRRDLLDDLELAGPAWQTSPYLTDGPDAFHAAIENGLEGVMAKRMDSRYHSGVRSRDWVKVKPVHTADVVVGGWRRGARELGAMLVGEMVEPGRLRFRGRVGGGIGDKAQRDLLAALRPLETERSPFDTRLATEDARGTTWVRPELTVEIAYGVITDDGRFRFPRFRRIRPDKPPTD